MDTLVGRRARLAQPQLARLTERELNVLTLMVQGKTNAGIGRDLHLSESAIEKHINAIFTKLRLDAETEIHRRVAAVVTFLHHTT